MVAPDVSWNYFLSVGLDVRLSRIFPWTICKHPTASFPVYYNSHSAKLAQSTTPSDTHAYPILQGSLLIVLLFLFSHSRLASCRCRVARRMRFSRSFLHPAARFLCMALVAIFRVSTNEPSCLSGCLPVGLSAWHSRDSREPEAD